MDLELDDDQTALVDAVRSVLAKEWRATSLRSLVERGTGADGLWRSFVGLDWPALCVPEDGGGMGYGVVESALVHEQCGRAVVPGPFFATTALYVPMVAALADDEQRSALLGPVAGGETTGTVALTELVADVVHDDAGRCTISASPEGKGWRLRGTTRSVIDGASADHIVLPARLSDGGCTAFVVSGSAVTATPVATTDATRHLAHIDVDTVVDGATRLGLADGSAAFVRPVDEAVVLLAAEVVGTCGTILDVVLDHVREREQFGVKIGSFQALKHRLADCYLDLEAARASVRYASVALAEGATDASVAASSAKALASDCAQRLGHEGIQMLGGLGFTWEHDMHLFVKRAMASSLLLGTAEDHRQRTARLLGLVPA